MQVVYFDVAGMKLKLDSPSDFLHSHVHLLLFFFFFFKVRSKTETQRGPEIWFLCSGEQEFT